jgi:hypothetical protein
MIKRNEKFILSNGKGYIEIRTTQDSPGSAIGLYSHNKPVILNWCECSGTILQEFLYHYSFTPEEDIAQLRHLVEVGFLEDQSLASQVQPLLSLLPSSEYELLLEDIPIDWFQGSNLIECLYHPEDAVTVMTTESSPKPPISLDYGLYYPYNHNFFATQSRASLSEDCILQWVEAIKQGVRPVILTIGMHIWDMSFEFILDGHHKMYAYHRLKIPPRRFCVSGYGKHPVHREDFPKDIEEAYWWKVAFHKSA